MQYMLLIQHDATPTPYDPEAREHLSEEDRNAIYADHKAASETAGVSCCAGRGGISRKLTILAVYTVRAGHARVGALRVSARCDNVVGAMAAELQRHSVGLTWCERGSMSRSAHALLEGERVWLIDPFEDEDALSSAIALGRPAGVIQLLDRHARDCETIASGLGVPLSRLPASLPGSPFQVRRVVWQRFWREVSLWWPQQETLIVAEAIGTAPVFSLGRAAGVHPMLRLTPPRGALSGYRPRVLLVGHGNTIDGGASDALHDALEHARGDLPRLALKLPSLLRGN